MLLRFILRFINLSNYLNFFYSFMIAKFSWTEKDYSRFLEYIFINLIFNPLNKSINFFIFCIKMILFILNILLTANNIVLRFFLIIIPVNIISFILSFSVEKRYLFVEFIFMFVDTYVLFWKYHIKCTYYEFRDMEVIELTDEEYEEYRKSLTMITAPDLRIYYPMRFALSSVMIRLTGVILSVSIFLILFFEFINLFVIVDSNFNELRRTVVFKLIESVNNYKGETDKYLDATKYSTKTYLGLIQCMLIVIYLYLYFCVNYLIFAAYVRFEILLELIELKHFIYNLIYNFLSRIFIYVLPIHLYYVTYHSYKIFSITKLISTFYNKLKLGMKNLIQFSRFIGTPVWRYTVFMIQVENPPAKQWSILVKLRVYVNKITNYFNFSERFKNELINHANNSNDDINSTFNKQIFNETVKPINKK